MVHTFVERELKFDVPTGFLVPSLSSVLPPGSRVETSTEHLRSVYYDTDDRALLRAQLTLRHRSGTTDTGWHLKIPHPPFRDEIHADADREDAPEELTRLVMGVSGGRQLKQIATMTTERTVTRVIDADGGTLVEIDDDEVHAAAGGGSAVLSTWREIEVESGPASGQNTAMLEALGNKLLKAGAQRSRSGSKLARAMQPIGLPSTSRRSRSAERSGSPASAVLERYLTEQYRAIIAGDIALRRGDDSVIHKTRVATRRMHSMLRVFKKLFQTDRAAYLDTELRWVAAELGEVRDRQVLRKRLDKMIDTIDDTLLLGPVKVRIDTQLDHEQREHWQRLQDGLVSDRYLRLLAELDAWVQRTPLTTKAKRPEKSIAKYVMRADHKVYRKLRRANKSGDVDQLHSARKAAKRARYAAEAAQPVLGKHAAAKNAKRYEKLQDLLGEHQDSLVSSELLRRLGAAAGVTEGENGFAFGIVYEREQNKARDARRRARNRAKRYRSAS